MIEHLKTKKLICPNIVFCNIEHPNCSHRIPHIEHLHCKTISCERYTNRSYCIEIENDEPCWRNHIHKS